MASALDERGAQRDQLRRGGRRRFGRDMERRGRGGGRRVGDRRPHRRVRARLLGVAPAATPRDHRRHGDAPQDPACQADSSSSTVCGPTHATDSSSATRSATSLTSSNVTSSSSAIVSIGVDVLAVHDRLLRRVAGDRAGVLERDRAGAGGVGAGALDLGLGRAVGAELGDDVAHPPVGLEHLARLESRRQLEHRHVGVGVRDGAHRVGEAALLSDLVEQARAHRASEQRRVDREHGALLGVAGLDRRLVGHPQVRLVGVALSHEDARPLRRRGLVRGGSGRLGKRVNSSSTAPFCGSPSRLPTRNAPPRSGAQRRLRNSTMPSRVNVSRMCSAGPSTGRPSG